MLVRSVTVSLSLFYLKPRPKVAVFAMRSIVIPQHSLWHSLWHSLLHYHTSVYNSVNGAKGGVEVKKRRGSDEGKAGFVKERQGSGEKKKGKSVRA